jgi:hypothetical protein
MSERTGSALLLGGYHVGAEMKGNSFLASRDVACVWGVVGAMEGFFFFGNCSGLFGFPMGTHGCEDAKMVGERWIS